MILKKRLKNLLYYGLVTSVSASACVGVVSYIGISLKTTYTDNSSSNNNTSNSGTQSVKALLDSKITELSIPTNFYSLTSNKYYSSLKLSSLLSDYTNDFKNRSVDNIVSEIQTLYPSFSTNDFYKDILFFLKNIYTNSSEKIGIEINKDEFSVTNNNISFDYLVTLTNFSNVTASFSINNQSFYIPANSVKTLEIKSDNSSFYFGLTKNYNNYYLNWYTSVDFVFNDKDYNFSNFSFTENNISPAIQTYVDGISGTSDYSTVSSNDEYYSTLSTDMLKTNIDSYLSKNMNFALNIMKYFAPLLEEMQNNNTVYGLLKNQKENISEMILVLLGIDSSNANYSAFKALFTDLLDPTKTLLETLSKDGSGLASLIAYFINSPTITSDVIYTYIKDINPNVSNQELETQKESLSSLVLYFINTMGTSINIDSNFIVGLLSTVFQKNTTTLSLLSYILSENESVILNMISSDTNTQQTYKQYIDFINLLIDNPANRVLDSLTSDKGKTLLSSILTNLMGSNSVQGDTTSNSLIISMLTQIISTSNTNFNVANFQSLLSELIIPLVKFLSNSANYSVNKEFKSISYSSADKTVSYEYNLSFVFKNSITFNLNSVLNILPNTLSFGKTSLPKSILTTMLKQDGKAFEITIGKDDKISFNFSGTDEKIYLTPTYSSLTSSYYAGFAIPYHLVMRFDMPTMFSSITSFYDISLSVLGIPSHPINDSIVNSLKSFLSDFLIRDYDFYGMISFTDSTKTISNYSSNVYRKNNYFKWKTPDSDFYTQLKQNITSTTSNTYSLKYVKSNAFKSTTVYENLSGSKPVINSSFIDTIKSSVMDYKSDVAPIITITPEVNSTIPISLVGINISSIEITLVKINVWFPYNVLDLTDESNPKLNNSFSVEITLA